MRGKIKTIQKFVTYRGKNWFKKFLIYTLHFTARWCSWCTVDHVHSFYKVGIMSSSPLRIAAIQTIDTSSMIFWARIGCVVLCMLNWESTQNIILCATQTRRTKINKIMHVPKTKINKIMLPVSPSGFSYQVHNIRIEKKINISSEWNLNSDRQFRRPSLGS